MEKHIRIGGYVTYESASSGYLKDCYKLLCTDGENKVISNVITKELTITKSKLTLFIPNINYDNSFNQDSINKLIKSYRKHMNSQKLRELNKVIKEEIEKLMEQKENE